MNNKIKTQLAKQIARALEENYPKALNYKQIAAFLPKGIVKNQKDLIPYLDNLVTTNVIKGNGKGKYSLRPSVDLIEGTIKKGRRENVLLTEYDEYPIAYGHNTQVLLGDIVRIKLISKGKSQQFAVIKDVIKRTENVFTGVVRHRGAKLIVECKGPFGSTFFNLEETDIEKGSMVALKFKKWEPTSRNPTGVVVEEIGDVGTPRTDIHTILSEFGVIAKFPVEVEAEAEKVVQEKLVVKDRLDFRKKCTFTIDPHDAKDFDDALSVEFKDNGNIEVAVHIADVAHYIQKGSDLDKEAYKRGNSIYLVDRTVPMLPESLSNGLCSLKPNEDRYAFSVIFLLNKEYGIINAKYAKTLIHSEQRFAYEDAQKILEDGQGVLFKELDICNKIAKHYREKRLQHGAMDISSSELRFVLDEKSYPIKTSIKKSFAAHKLVEEWMLLANKYVATYIFKSKDKNPMVNGIYRIHDNPSAEKLVDLKKFLSGFGYHIQIEKVEDLRQSLSETFVAIKGKPEEALLSRMIIRSMAKAIYGVKKTSHFGLGFDFYTHFTSPIRRYPDLITHRVLQAVIENKKTNYSYTELEKAGIQCSKTEQKAVNAERASTKYMMALYLEKQIGKEFEGIVTGITSWGIYVEIIENMCEGMARLSDIKFDKFYFDEARNEVVGRRTKTIIRLGDTVKIKVKNAVPQKRQIDFDLIK